MRISEIFYSIQGESTFAGVPCAFVRVAGCPLRCAWCDTAYAFHGGDDMRVDEIVERVESFGCPVVEITGGEPLDQMETFELLSRFADAGKTVLVETSGAVDIARVDARAVIIMDLKCPGSGMSHHNRWENVARLKPIDQVKFVLRDRSDYMWAREVVDRMAIADRHVVLFSPVFGELDPSELAAWILEDRLRVRLQLQLHKLLWDPAARGV